MSLIHRLHNDPEFELTLVIGSSLLEKEYGKAEKYIRASHPGLEIISLIYMEEKDHVKRSARISEELGAIFTSTKYDAVIVVADRYETLPATMAAAYLNIPLIHIQGGEVTGNIDERVRHAVTKLSDYHFVATEMAKEYVKRMGEERYRVFYTGCPSLDLIKKWSIKRMTPKKKYIMCIFHPDTEKIEDQYEETKIMLNAVIDYCVRHKQKCYWFFPNADPGREKIIKALNEAKKAFSNHLVKYVNEDPFNFLSRVAGARFVIGNSSLILRETSFIGVPSINVGFRQNLRERSFNVIDTEVNYDSISLAMETQLQAKKYKRSYLYGRGCAADYIAAHLNRIEISQKGTITYPTEFEFKHKHLGEVRLHEHRKTRLRKRA